MGGVSYTPAPLRSLYGLVARPALFCLSDNTQSGSDNRNGQINNRNPAFDNTRSGSRAKPESVFVFMPQEREQQGSGSAANPKLDWLTGAILRPVKIFPPAV